MYDTSVEKTMTGKLVRFVIGANHSQYVMEVIIPTERRLGRQRQGCHLDHRDRRRPSQLERQNITVETFKIGTIFTLTFSPLRDGRNGGANRAPLIMCGMKMPYGGCNDKTGKKYAYCQRQLICHWVIKKQDTSANSKVPRRIDQMRQMRSSWKLRLAMVLVTLLGAWIGLQEQRGNNHEDPNFNSCTRPYLPGWRVGAAQR